MEKILKEIETIEKHTFDNLHDKENKKSELYKQLSEFLFKAAKENDKNTIKEILLSPNISAKNLLDENGYNIIEYCLFNSDNELFYFLYENLYDYVDCCFAKIPELFTITFKKENFELVRFFLKNFGKYLKKINIVECLFKAVEYNQEDIINSIIDNFSDFIDSRNLQASIIYFISYNKLDALKVLFSKSQILNKILDKDIEKMFLLSILNKNDKVIEIMLSNKYFNDALNRLDENLIKNINNLAYENKNLVILENLQNLLK
ncbi:MAG TPA: hypothetical protein VLL98_00510 [Rickettsiales bacterium]|nr:hypothetical protein [Rickettsiales bacterium]